MEIRYAVGTSVLGATLVAVTQQGLCALLLGDAPQALTADLRRRFPRATLTGDAAGLQTLLARVAKLVEQPGAGEKLTLAPRGTEFQKRVWGALREIPPGTTATYTGLAQQLGVPRSVRAVAQACAANPLAVAIPCHRVVRKDGGLAGFRWGLHRKRALLDRER